MVGIERLCKKKRGTMTYRFEFIGEPVAKGRPKICARGGFARAYTPAKTRNAEAWIKMQTTNQLPKGFTILQGPLVARIYFIRKYPKFLCLKNPQKQTEKRKGKYPITKPDLDNLIKTILDAMNGLVFEDDNQIVALYAEKKYGEEGKTVVELMGSH